jgi:hypothetical protein
LPCLPPSIAFAMNDELHTRSGAAPGVEGGGGALRSPYTGETLRDCKAGGPGALDRFFTKPQPLDVLWRWPVATASGEFHGPVTVRPWAGRWVLCVAGDPLADLAAWGHSVWGLNPGLRVLARVAVAKATGRIPP